MEWPYPDTVKDLKTLITLELKVTKDQEYSEELEQLHYAVDRFLSYLIKRKESIK
jgi:hypothetical protein